MKNKKICFVVTVEQAVNSFLVDHLRVLSDSFEVTLCVNTNNTSFLVEQGLDVRVIAIGIQRKISIISDVLILAQLIYLFVVNKFAVVHSITPKAGLIGMLAAFIARVPIRIHTFTGQVWVTKVGLKKFILKKIDTLIASLSTYGIIDSESQKDFLIEERVINSGKAIVFGSGSICGVDLKKFKSNSTSCRNVRKELSIPNTAFVFIYLGRLNEDKGVVDLARAFSSIIDNNAYLLIVGQDEDGILDRVKEIIKDKISHVRLVGFSRDPNRYLSASNVLCLPSYREGFGNVIIEAAAMGIPSIASDIYGIRDAIEDNNTGLLHKPREVSHIKEKMNRVLNSKSLVILLGQNAKKRALEKFDSIVISGYWLNFYKALCDV